MLLTDQACIDYCTGHSLLSTSSQPTCSHTSCKPQGFYALRIRESPFLFMSLCGFFVSVSVEDDTPITAYLTNMPSNCTESFCVQYKGKSVCVIATTFSFSRFVTRCSIKIDVMRGPIISTYLSPQSSYHYRCLYRVLRKWQCTAELWTAVILSHLV